MTTVPEPAADPLVGRTIAGKYTVERRLGAGAMGIVYRATQIALDRTVAIKVLHRELASDPEFAERFGREAKVASRLDHPNSIRVLDFGQEPDGLLYLVMEYIEGSDLFDWLGRRGPPSPLTIVDILSQILAALAVAHDMAVVHRDLKPENVLMVRGRSDDGRAIELVKVCDFGIAKLLDVPSSAGPDDRRRRGSTGLVIGTPAYMSPEQARGEQQDARSDLYAVGVLLYELLVGRVPFEAENQIAVALKHVSEQPERPSARASGVDPGLEAICLKAISKKPADRYQTAREMRLALQNAASTFAPSAALSFSAHGSSRPRHDSSKATLAGVAPGTPAPRAQRSKGWFALLIAPALAGALLVRLRAPLGHEPVRPGSSASGSVNGTPVPSTAGLMPALLATSRASAAVSARAPAALGKRPGPRNELLTRSAAKEELPVLEAPPPAERSLALEPVQAKVAPSAPAVPDTKTAEPAPPPPRYDLALARVAIGSARNVVGATATSVTRAVSEAAPRISACYKTALPQLGAAFEGSDVLHVDTDGAGVITVAHLSGPVRGGAAACIAGAVLGHRIANVDTGSASADVPLSFRAH